MGNRLNYRCPKCGSPDEIEICAFVSIRLTPTPPRLPKRFEDIDGFCWSQDNAAGCGACGYEGAVRDFSALPPGVVSLNEYRHRR
jgi:hypothetical protein